MVKHILHIHGFNSSPLSVKAEQSRKFFALNYPEVVFHCPQLATSPQQAIQQLEKLIEQTKGDTSWFIIGSSLGGFFASYLSNKYKLPAVLINPAVKPYELLVDYLGEQCNPYTNITYQVTPEHMQQLKALKVNKPMLDSEQKNNYLVMVQTGDEVLDYQQAVDEYQHCSMIVEQGGDHSFVHFDEKLPIIADFFKLNQTELA